MATATISAVAVKVRTDLGSAPDAGPSVATFSAKLAPDVYHRINPYFFRPSDLTNSVKLKFVCEHNPSNSVAYSANGKPPAQKWTGTVKVDATRTSRSVESVKNRPITVTSAPTTNVSRTIVCTFDAVKVYNSRTQQWVKLPTSTDKPGCDLLFELRP